MDDFSIGIKAIEGSKEHPLSDYLLNREFSDYEQEDRAHRWFKRACIARKTAKLQISHLLGKAQKGIGERGEGYELLAIILLVTMPLTVIFLKNWVWTIGNIGYHVDVALKTFAFMFSGIRSQKTAGIWAREYGGPEIVTTIGYGVLSLFKPIRHWIDHPAYSIGVLLSLQIIFDCLFTFEPQLKRFFQNLSPTPAPATETLRQKITDHLNPIVGIYRELKTYQKKHNLSSQYNQLIDAALEQLQYEVELLLVFLPKPEYEKWMISIAGDEDNCEAGDSKFNAEWILSAGSLGKIEQREALKTYVEEDFIKPMAELRTLIESHENPRFSHSIKANTWQASMSKILVIIEIHTPEFKLEDGKVKQTKRDKNLSLFAIFCFTLMGILCFIGLVA